MTRLNRISGLGSVLVTLAACSQPTPQTTTTSQKPQAVARPEAKACDAAKLDLLLQAPHDPPTRDELFTACDNPVPKLSALAEDTSARGLLRLRAIEALGEVGGADALRVLAGRATASGDLASIRRSALSALGRATPADSSDRERVGLSALSDPDPHVRVAAAKLLAPSGSPSVRSALEQARDHEGESFVRDEIQRALGRE